MTLKTRCLHFLCALMVAEFSPLSAAEDMTNIRFYAESNPPWSFEIDGRPSGINVDILVEALTRLGIPKPRSKIIMAPWSRGFAEAQKVEKVGLIGVVRTQAREKLFKWIGPVGAMQIGLVGKTNVAPSLDELGKFSYVAIRDGVAAYRLTLLNLPPEKTLHAVSSEHAAVLLIKDRVDLWAGSDTMIYSALKMHGEDETAYQMLHTFDPMPLYFVLSPKTKDTLVFALQAALDEIRDSSRCTEVIESYPNVDLDGYCNVSPGN